MTYDVDYFIKKFEAIPENKWCIGEADNGAGQHCAMGHCTDYTEYRGFTEILQTLSLGDSRTYMSKINNGSYPQYRQPSPKQRILAALHDIKKLNQGTGTSTERRNEVTSELQRADITKKLSQIEIVSETSDLKKELC